MLGLGGRLPNSKLLKKPSRVVGKAISLIGIQIQVAIYSENEFRLNLLSTEPGS